MHITKTVCDICGEETTDTATATVKWCNSIHSHDIHICKERCYPEVKQPEERNTFIEIAKRILPKWGRR